MPRTGAAPLNDVVPAAPQPARAGAPGSAPVPLDGAASRRLCPSVPPQADTTTTHNNARTHFPIVMAQFCRRPAPRAPGPAPIGTLALARCSLDIEVSLG